MKPNESTGPSDQLQLMNPPPGSSSSPQVPAVLHDIHPPVELPEPPPYLLFGAGGALFAILIGLLLWYLYKRKNMPLPPTPPGIVARNELMEARPLINEGEALEYMARVSSILRRYIENRFRLKPTRQTTGEFFRVMKVMDAESPLAPYREPLQQCLESCDMAKYARRTAQKSQLEQMENTVLDFITTTSAALETEEGR